MLCPYHGHIDTLHGQLFIDLDVLCVGPIEHSNYVTWIGDINSILDAFARIDLDYGGMSEAEACEIRDDKLLKMLKYSKELGDALPPASSQVDTMKVAS